MALPRARIRDLNPADEVKDDAMIELTQDGASVRGSIIQVKAGLATEAYVDQAILDAGVGGGGGGIPEAPMDGQTYGRNSGFWTVTGGSGTGDDIDTTPVAPSGASPTAARPMPDWLAGAPIIICPEDVLISPEHRGAWLHMTSDIGSTIYLTGTWAPGMAFGARWIGIGPVQWALTGSATMQLPFTKFDHTGISERYEEVVFRVISNTAGNNAVWAVSGGSI